MSSLSDKIPPSPPATARSRRSTPRAHTPNTISQFARWSPSIIRPAVGRPKTAGHARPPVPPLPTDQVQSAQPGPSSLPRVGQGKPSSVTPRSSRTPAAEASSQETSDVGAMRKSKTRPMSAPSKRPEEQGVRIPSSQAAAPSESSRHSNFPDGVSEADVQEFLRMESDKMFWKRRFFSKAELDGAGPSSFEVVMSGAEPNQLTKDYLTWYYCDFFETDPVEQLPLTEQDTTTVTKIVDWLNRFRPRTRIDAYPMLQVALDVISRLTRQELKVEYEHYDAFQAEIEALQRTANERQNVIDTLNVEREQLHQIIEQLKGTIQHMNDTHESKVDEIRVAAEKRELELSNSLQQVTDEKDARIAELDHALTTTKEDLFHFKSQLARTSTEAKAFQARMLSLQTELREVEAKQELARALERKDAKADKRAWVFQNIARTSLTAHFTSWKVLTAARIRLGRQQEVECTAIRRRVDYRFLRNAWVAWDDAVTRGFRYRSMVRTALQRACTELFRQWADAVRELKWDASVQRARELMRRTMDRSVASITAAWRAWARKMGVYRRIAFAIDGAHQLRLLRVAFRVLRHLSADRLLQQSGWTGASADRPPPRPGGPRRPAPAPGALSPRSPRDRLRDPGSGGSGSTPRSQLGGIGRFSRRDLMQAAQAAERSGLGLTTGQTTGGKRPPVDLSGVGSAGLKKTSTSAEGETFLKALQTKARTDVRR